MTPAEYIETVVREALPHYAGNLVIEFGFSFEDFIAKFAKSLPVAYASYSGFSEVEAREANSDDAEIFTLYLRNVSADLYEDVRAVRKFVKQKDVFFEDVYNERRQETEQRQWFVKVGTGNPTLFTKGFDSFELNFVFTN